MAITWNNTIKQQFSATDIAHMKQVSHGRLRLDDFSSVKSAADEIWDHVSKDLMPPGRPWSSKLKNNFKVWVENGMPEGDVAATVSIETAPAIDRALESYHHKVYLHLSHLLLRAPGNRQQSLCSWRCQVF